MVRWCNDGGGDTNLCVVEATVKGMDCEDSLVLVGSFEKNCQLVMFVERISENASHDNIARHLCKYKYDSRMRSLYQHT